MCPMMCICLCIISDGEGTSSSSAAATVVEDTGELDLEGISDGEIEQVSQYMYGSAMIHVWYRCCYQRMKLRLRHSCGLQTMLII